MFILTFNYFAGTTLCPLWHRWERQWLWENLSRVGNSVPPPAPIDLGTGALCAEPGADVTEDVLGTLVPISEDRARKELPETMASCTVCWRHQHITPRPYFAKLNKSHNFSFSGIRSSEWRSVTKYWVQGWGSAIFFLSNTAVKISRTSISAHTLYSASPSTPLALTTEVGTGNGESTQFHIGFVFFLSCFVSYLAFYVWCRIRSSCIQRIVSL